MEIMKCICNEMYTDKLTLYTMKKDDDRKQFPYSRNRPISTCSNYFY